LPSSLHRKPSHYIGFRNEKYLAALTQFLQTKRQVIFADLDRSEFSEDQNAKEEK
jgi:hypothetical protein